MSRAGERWGEPCRPTGSRGVLHPLEKRSLPCFQDLLADGFDVLEAVKATDVIDQDVGMDAPEPPATHVRPLLQGAERDQSWLGPVAVPGGCPAPLWGRAHQGAGSKGSASSPAPTPSTQLPSPLPSPIPVTAASAPPQSFSHPPSPEIPYPPR